MTVYTHSVVSIVPAGVRIAADQMGVAMQWLFAGPGALEDRSHLVPLAPTTVGPVTHWGMVTVCREAVGAMICRTTLPAGVDWSLGGAQDLDLAGAQGVVTARAASGKAHMQPRSAGEGMAHLLAVLATMTPPLKVVPTGSVDGQ